MDDGDGNTCTITLSGGSGSCSLPSTDPGSKTLTAAYQGDARFNTSSDTEPHTVNKADTTTTITSDNPDASVVGQSYTVNATVAAAAPGSGTPSGAVNVDDGDGNTCTITLSGGSGSCSLTSTSVGSKTLTAAYQGDANFNTSNDTESHTVNKADTTTTITSDNPDASVVGQSYTVNATVAAAAPGSGTPAGTVNVDDGDGNTCTITLSGGSGSCSLTSTSAGSKTITAAYQGDARFNTSSDTESHTVNKANTTTVINSDTPDASVVGQSYTVNATVAAVAPGSGTPSGTVNVDDGDGNTCTITLSGGSGSCSLTSTSVGSKTLTAAYQGDANFNTSNDTESHTVNKADTTTTITSDNPDASVVGQSYTVNATVAAAAPGSGTPAGTVNVDDGDGNTCTITLSGGSGSCSLTSTSVGSKTLTAAYQGDANFKTSSDTEPHTVNQANTTTTINSDNPDPSVVGQSYTVNATVAAVAPGSGTPSGTVNVDDGDGNSCTITLSGGSGSCSLPSTSIGDKTLTAAYQGDANFNSSSDTEPHAVHAPDLTVSKANDVSGAIFLGYNWTWTLSVQNTGNADAIFTDGQTILTDNLPNTNMSYGAPSVTNVNDVTGSANISCVISGSPPNLTCSASGGDVTIATASGRFDVQFTATPSVAGTFDNPRSGGSCKVDPDNRIPESNEGNNTADEDSVTVTGATITIVKDAIPDAAQNFSFSGDLGSFTLDDATPDDGDAFSHTITFSDRYPKAYALTEALPPTWDLTGFTCQTDDPNDTSALNGDTATIDLDPGEIITCTITNTQRGIIIVQKQTNPASDTVFGFVHDVDATARFNLSHDQTRTFNNVVPGTYTITEDDPLVHGFELTELVCLDDDSAGTPSTTNLEARQASIHLDPGETVNCTFTNAQKGSITIEKVTDPPGGTGFAFTHTIQSPNSFSLDHDQRQTFTNVRPGTYTVTETDPLVTPGGYDLTDLVCVETGTANSTASVATRTATITFEVGEIVICTFTNTWSLSGDLNRDCEVDIEDVMLVAGRWHTSCATPDPDNDPGTANYDDLYDLDDDCDIDIVDIMLVVTHWGETC